MSWQPDYARDIEGDTRPNPEDACPVCDKVECVCREISCNLCGARSASLLSLDEISRWIVDHGCDFGKTISSDSGATAAKTESEPVPTHSGAGDSFAL